MIRGKDQSHFVVKVFLAIVFIVLITTYNSAFYSSLRDLKQINRHFKNKFINEPTEINVSSIRSTTNRPSTTKHKISTSPLPKGFLIWNDNCHIPSMDPFAPHYMEKYKEEIGPNCTEKIPLVTKSYNKKLESYTLHINQDLKHEYMNASSNDSMQCCFKQILRNGDKEYKLLDCKMFQEDFTVPNDVDYSIIECSGKRNTTVFYQDGMHFIHLSSTVKEKIKASSQPPRRPFGLLLFGIDSLSQFNFRRVMPRTFHYVQNHSWFELSGYNKKCTKRGSSLNFPNAYSTKGNRCGRPCGLNSYTSCISKVYNYVYHDISNTARHFVFIKFRTTENTSDIIQNVTSFVASSVPDGYLVWSDNCHMPSLDALSAEFMEAMTEEFIPAPNCSVIETPLVSKSYNNTLQSYILHINMDLKDLYLNETDGGDIYCCYTEISRSGDSGYGWSPECIDIPQDFVVPTAIDYMIIECSNTTNTSVFYNNNQTNTPIIYQDGITFIQERPEVNDKLQNNTHVQRPFGILMFGIDSISQFNFRRVMPDTFNYVQNYSWFELSGYNKIADNTFPNLMAIFTGLDLEKADELCHYHEPGGLDNCPTLFNLFKRQGFVTAYAEDTCQMSTFDYLKPGFLKPPTDYYQRPLLLAIEENLPIKKLSGLQYCIGNRRYGEYIIDFGVEFAERFLGQSIFGLFWTNSFSHNDWIDPSTMDQRMVEYFNYMDSADILDNNVVIFFSDHGARWGFLRTQKEGYIEERLPMFFIRLPKWFQDEHPNIVQSLILNKNRLTSPYDLHVTLKHLALLSLGKNEPIDLPISCPTCQTLFVPVSDNRTCPLAGIDEHWCTCTPFETLDRDSEEMTNLTKLVIDEMNIYLNASSYADKCVTMEFKRNVEANLKLDLHQDVHANQIKTYRMNFETNPNSAAFDATFLYDTVNKTITIDVTEISRLNSYAKDSECIDDNIVKKYCICANSVNKDR